MIELVLSIFLGEGWGWGEMQMYYSPCLTKHPSGSVNMPSVLVYFTFNDLGIKRSHYTFRPYPVDFFFTHLVSVSWLAFFLWVSGWWFYFSRSFSFKKVWSSAFLHSMHIYTDCWLINFLCAVFPDWSEVDTASNLIQALAFSYM